jgi:hypothetical protein
MPVENDRDGAENKAPEPGGFVWGLKPQASAETEAPRNELPGAEPVAEPDAAAEAEEPVPLIVPTPAFWVPIPLTPAVVDPLVPPPLVPPPLVPPPLVPAPLAPPPLAVPRTDATELRAAMFTPAVPEHAEAPGMDSLFGTLSEADRADRADRAGNSGDAPTVVAPVAAAMPAFARNTFTPASAAGAASSPQLAPATSGGDSRPPLIRILIWVAAGLLAAVVLLGLFFLGQNLACSAAPAVASASPTPTPTPTPTSTTTQLAGVHAWDTLNGGECLEPYVSPWEEDFTVVDCAEPHAAQLVYVGTFAEAAGDFPGEEALASQVNLLCSIPGVIDLTAAGEYPDVQVQASYPVTAEQWDAGSHEYSCFVSRASAEPFTASLAGPGPAPAG